MLKSLKAKLAVGTSLVMGSFASFAQDHSALITAAGTDGQTNVSAAVTVVLTIAGILTAVGVVYGLLTRR